MPKRFTDSEKWNDPWFRKLTPTAKLMCLYLYDRCDIAGFWEIDLEAAAFEIGVEHQDILEAMKGLERCYEVNGDRIWITRFISFQGNKDLNEQNKAHLGIMRLLRAREGFSENVSRVLNRIELPSPYEGAGKGLLSLTSISTGKGSSKSNGKGMIESFSETDSVIDYLNEKASSSFRHSAASRKNIGGRLAELFTFDNCKLVIDFKCSEWIGTDFDKYLTPETLFRPSKFENNLNAAKKWDASGRKKPSSNGNGTNRALTRGAEEFADVFEES